MNLVEELWDKYAKTIQTKDGTQVPPHVLKQLRKVYYAGSQATYVAIIQAGEKDIDESSEENTPEVLNQIAESQNNYVLEQLFCQQANPPVPPPPDPTLN